MKRNTSSSDLFSVGDVIEVYIENQNPGNEGICKIEDIIVFVKGAKVGERCKARIIDLKRTYAIGEKIG